MEIQTLHEGEKCTPVFHGVLLLIHDLVMTRNGHLWWNNQNYHSWAELSSLLHKGVGQPIVFAKGRVQPDHQVTTGRQVTCSNAPRFRRNTHNSYTKQNKIIIISQSDKL